MVLSKLEDWFEDDDFGQNRTESPQKVQENLEKKPYYVQSKNQVYYYIKKIEIKRKSISQSFQINKVTRPLSKSISFLLNSVEFAEFSLWNFPVTTKTFWPNFQADWKHVLPKNQGLS